MTPFELLTGVKMRIKEQLHLRELLEELFIEQFENELCELRNTAKENLLKIQEENRNQYNLRRRKPCKYKLNDLVAIKRTQIGPGNKLRDKFFLAKVRATRVLVRNT